MSLTPNSPLMPAVARRRRQMIGALIGIVILVGLAAVGLLVNLRLTSQNQNVSSKAAPATTLSLTTPQTQLTVGQTFTVNIEANTGTNVVKALDVSLSYDPAVVQLLDLSKGPWLNQADQAVKTIDQAGGKGLIGLVIPPTANPPHAIGQGVAVTATFKALAVSGSTLVSFNTPATLAGAANEPQNVVNNYSNLNLTVVPVGGVTPTPVTSDFYVYSYAACIDNNSDGHNTYIVWNNQTFANVNFIDVSDRADFSNPANKAPTNPQVLPNHQVVTDGTNFRHSDQSLFIFNPGITYYFRLAYANTHSATVTYQATQCAGSSGKQCNDSCSNSSECATNLTCDGGRCRRNGNTGDDQCLLPPDKGLQHGCNEYCANDSECGSGMKCWWNQCRNAQNLTDAACKVIVKPGFVAGCNKSCNSNVECDANLRCYNQQCRLIVNPTNTTCQPTQAATSVRTITPKPTTVPTLVPSPTASRATVSARIQIDQVPTSPSTRTVADFPVTATTVPAKTTSASSTGGGFLSWLPAILVVVFVGLLAVLFGPQVLAIFSGGPKAIVPKSTGPMITNPGRPTPPLQPASQAPSSITATTPTAPPGTSPVPPAQKLHFGTPVNSEVSSMQPPKV